MASARMFAKLKKKQKFQVRHRNRCRVCGRSRGYYRKFELCRICLRLYSLRSLASATPCSRVTRARRCRFPR